MEWGEGIRVGEKGRGGGRERRVKPNQDMGEVKPGRVEDSEM